MEKLAFDASHIRQQGLVYKMLYCVKHLKYLYLINKLEQSNFLSSQNVLNEMKRHRKHSSCQIEYGLFSKQENNSILISSLNTPSLPLHIEEIYSDYGLMKSDIIYLQEINRDSLPRRTLIL